MLRLFRTLVSLVTTCALLLSGVVLVPQGALAFRLVRSWEAPDTTARLRLDTLVPADYRREAQAALAEGDPELAQSILQLAQARRIAMPADLAPQVDAALEAQGGTFKELWNGAVYGDADGTAGFAAALATDLMVVGDIRDLARQAWAYPDYDPVVVALATLGIGLTAASVASAGTATPVKLGASALKLARKTGRLGAALSADLLRLARRAVDGAALEDVFRAARRLDRAEVQRLSSRVLRREATEELGSSARALGSIASGRGPKGVLDALRVSDSTGEVVRLARVAERTGPGFRGALRLAPRLVKTLAKASWAFVKWVLWLAAGALWVLWLVWTGLRLVRRLALVIVHALIGAARLAGPRRPASA
ncbi:MAG: hypothetical protein INR68_09515 [Methylobacterium mesophilicum]|nr:hypothetical protein [Methylobacterium mesophilicum]